MASTNKTTNYELSQFIETDRPAWLTDYNSDMRKLDTALKGVSDVASGASGSISSLTDRMTAAEGAISTNANDIDALDARADVLEAQAQSTSGTIANIQTEQTAQNLGIEAATELGYNLARPYDSASTYAVGDYVLFQNTLYKCVTAVATGEAFDPTKWLAIKATDEIAAGGYTLPIASASELGGFKVGNNLSIDPLTGILSASGGGVEIIPLNDTNFTITGANIASASQIGNYYDPDTDVTTTTLTTPTLSNYTFNIAGRPSVYYKIGNMRLLILRGRVTYSDVTVAAKSRIIIDFRGRVNTSIIDLPSSSINSQHTWRTAYDDISTQIDLNNEGNLAFTLNKYNSAASAQHTTHINIDGYLIYNVI